MPLANLVAGRTAAFAAGTLTVLAGLLALAVLFWPAPAHAQASGANTNCRTSSSPYTLDFGTSQLATFQVTIICHNNAPTGTTTVNACLGFDPGVSRPLRMTFGGSQLTFELYIDAARTIPWTTTQPAVAMGIVIPAGADAVRTITLYGRTTTQTGTPPGAGQFYQLYMFGPFAGHLATPTSCQHTGLPNILTGQVFTLLTRSAAPVAGCTLGTIAGIDFGTRSGLVDYADAAGSVQLNCPLNRAWTLTFSGGGNLSGSVRRMRSAAGDYLPYAIYRDTNRTSPIAVNGTITGTGTNANQTTPVYGRVDPATPPAAGLYQDTIVVTLSF